VVLLVYRIVLRFAAHKANILVRQPHLHHQRFINQHQHHQNNTRLNHDTHHMRHQILDPPILQHPQFQQTIPIILLNEFESQPIEALDNFDPLDLELPLIFTLQLHNPTFEQHHVDLFTNNDIQLNLVIALLLNTLAHLIVHHQTSSETILHQPPKNTILLAIMQQYLLQLTLDHLRHRQLLTRTLPRNLLLRDNRIEHIPINNELQLHLPPQQQQITNLLPQRRTIQLRINTTQHEQLLLQLHAQNFTVNNQQNRIHAHQELSQTHKLTLDHQDLLDNTNLRKLNDLERGIRNQPTRHHNNNIQSRDNNPDQRHHQQPKPNTEHRTQQKPQ